jgi:hypothetical protein
MDFVFSHDLIFSSATINSPVGLPVGGTFSNVSAMVLRNSGFRVHGPSVQGNLLGYLGTVVGCIPVFLANRIANSADRIANSADLITIFG